MSHSLSGTHYSSQKGFTLIELLIATFIIGTVVTGLFGLFVLNLRLAHEGERRVVAIALANERAELIRNLPYQAVGTVGGVPAGSLPQQATIVRNGIAYDIRTDIRYFDDPYDNVAPTDTLNADYKIARIEVAWPSPSNPSPLLLHLTIAPAGIEGGEAAGTLSFTALNAAGQGVAAAAVEITNAAVDPPITINTQTDNNGRVMLPGLPEYANSYALHVSRDGFTSEKTFDITTDFIPDPDHAHLSMQAGVVTSKTFLIDALSQLTVHTQDEEETPLGAIAYSLRGSKTIGTDAAENPIYVTAATVSTNAAGNFTHDDVVWDSFIFAVDGAVTGYDIKETSLLLPLQMDPGEEVTLGVTLVPHTPHSLHVTVASPTGQPVDNASVHLSGNGFDETLGTGILGQVLFSDLPTGGNYAITVDAPGYDPYEGGVSVADTSFLRVDVTAVIAP